MSIFEIRPRPITHSYLMNKTKNDLASLAIVYHNLWEKSEKDKVVLVDALQEAEDALLGNSEYTTSQSINLIRAAIKKATGGAGS